MRRLLVLLYTMALLAVTAGSVSAHASLVRADPAPNAVLANAPRSVNLWFDEDLDPQFSSVSLLDSAQNRVDLGQPRVSADRKQIAVDVRQDLPPGAYTVAWRALSAVDGHTTRGAYAIFIGAAAAGQAAPVNPQSAEVSPLPLPLDVLVRWLNLLAAMGLAGALTVGVLSGDDTPAFAAVRAAAARRTRLFLVACLLVLFLGTVVSQLMQAMVASERSLGEVLAQSIWLQTLTTTRFGQAGLARILLVDALLILVMGSGGDRLRLKWLWNVRAADALYLLLSLAVLFSISLASHSASSADPLKLSLPADFVHLTAVSMWTGGLFALALLLSPALGTLHSGERVQTARAILRRFSRIAMAAVALFVLTGIYSMWRQIGYVGAFASNYGAALIVKSLLIVPLLLIGLINTLALHPEWAAVAGRFGRGARAPVPRSDAGTPETPPRPTGGRTSAGTGTAPRAPATRAGRAGLAGSARADSNWLERLASASPQTVLRYVRAEAVLGALVVLAAATMTALPPARGSVPPPPPPPFASTRQTSDLRAALRVEPYAVGNQTFTVRVTDPQDAPLGNVQRVSLRFTFLGADLGTSTQEMQSAGDDAYTLQGGYLSVVGAWKTEVIVRRRGVEDDARLPFRLNVIDPNMNRAEEVPYINSSLVFALVDLAAGIGLLVFSRRRKVTEGVWVGAGAIALGVLLFGMGLAAAPPASATLVTNPIVPDETSLAIGKRIYEENCVACHGPTGRGNGPLAVSLNPRPADFLLHINAHSDEVTFNWISRGIPGTAMPAWEGKLSPEERWHVINYIQALIERQQATPTPAPVPTRAP